MYMENVEWRRNVEVQKYRELDRLGRVESWGELLRNRFS